MRPIVLAHLPAHHPPHLVCLLLPQWSCCEATACTATPSPSCGGRHCWQRLRCAQHTMPEPCSHLVCSVNHTRTGCCDKA